jgi:hypothetical protein
MEASGPEGSDLAAGIVGRGSGSAVLSMIFGAGRGGSERVAVASSSDGSEAGAVAADAGSASVAFVASTELLLARIFEGFSGGSSGSDSKAASSCAARATASAWRRAADSLRV